MLALLLDRKIIAATVGDSIAVLGQRVDSGLRALSLSATHAPDEPGEKARIEDMGGHVEPAADDGSSPARVFFANGTLPGLAISRSLGDHYARRIGVISQPSMVVHERGPTDDHLILASDGVWAVMTPQEAVEIVGAERHATRGCTALLRVAMQRWADKKVAYRDDITAVVRLLDAGGPS